MNWSSLRSPFWKAVVFGLSWFLFPFWLFVLIALYLYFFPTSQSGRLAIPFFVLLTLAFVEPKGYLFALVFGGAFFYILTIKDLLLIDRKAGYEILVLLLSFLLLRDFYIKFSGGIEGAALWYALLSAGIFGSLFVSFISCFAEETVSARALARPAEWLVFLLGWQFIVAGLFVPLDYIYQTIIVFLGMVLLVDLVPHYLFEGMSRSKALATSGFVFSMLVLVLGSARWGL